MTWRINKTKYFRQLTEAGKQCKLSTSLALVHLVLSSNLFVGLYHAWIYPFPFPSSHFKFSDVDYFSLFLLSARDTDPYNLGFSHRRDSLSSEFSFPPVVIAMTIWMVIAQKEVGQSLKMLENININSMLWKCGYLGSV